MKLGKDFWLILRIAFVVIKALIEFLGDEDDVREAKENGFGNMYD